MLAFVAVVKRSLNTKKVSIALIAYMNVRCQAIDANIKIKNRFNVFY